MTIMNKIIEILLDYVFPPKEIEIKLRNISKEDLYLKHRTEIITEFPFIKSIFSYKDELIKELIWQIKYKKNKHAIQCAGYALFKEISEYLNKNNIESAILLPIPISKSRRNERGFNQSEIIIDEIIKNDTNGIFKKDFFNLIRIKDIDKQTHKNRNDRLENSKNIFQYKNDTPSNSQIIIIDDVTTTGSTLINAKNAIDSLNQLNVLAFTLAH
jgi:competence protein ComFC